MNNLVTGYSYNSFRFHSKYFVTRNQEESMQTRFYKIAGNKKQTNIRWVGCGSDRRRDRIAAATVFPPGFRHIFRHQKLDAMAGTGEGQVYVVDYIAKERIRHGNREYMIKWKGFPESQNTWEVRILILKLIGLFPFFKSTICSPQPEENIDDPSLITDFEESLRAVKSTPSSTRKRSRSHTRKADGKKNTSRTVAQTTATATPRRRNSSTRKNVAKKSPASAMTKDVCNTCWSEDQQLAFCRIRFSIQ